VKNKQEKWKKKWQKAAKKRARRLAILADDVQNSYQ